MKFLFFVILSLFVFVASTNLRPIVKNDQKWSLGSNAFTENVTSLSYSGNNEYVNCTDANQYSAQCDFNGICLSNGNCKCDSGYITWPQGNSVGCTYKQKQQLIAFLLSFFVGEFTGAGEWYLGNNDIALAQLLVFVLGLPFVIIFACIGCAGGSRSNKTAEGAFGAGGCGACVWFLTIVGLWLFVWIAILTGYIVDGNGAPLEPM